MNKKVLSFAGIKSVLMQHLGTVPASLSRDLERVRAEERKARKPIIEVPKLREWKRNLFFRAFADGGHTVLGALSLRRYVVMPNGEWRRIPAKLRGKAAVKAHKRARMAA